MKILKSISMVMGIFIFSTKIFCTQLTEDDLKSLSTKPLETHEHEIIKSDQKTDVIYYTAKQSSTTYSIIQINSFGESNYLAPYNTIAKRSYQKAIFGSKNFLDRYPKQCPAKFTLIPEKDGTYLIQSR